MTDLDKDGLPDLVSITGLSFNSGLVSVQKGQGDGSFDAAVNIELDVAPKFLVVTDLNDDGDSDLLVSSRNGQLLSLLGNGDGTYADPIASPINRFLSEAHLTVDDFSGDGVPDVAVGVSFFGSATDLVEILLGNGDGELFRSDGLRTRERLPCNHLARC